MENLEISDPWLRRAAAEFLDLGPQAVFGIAEGTSDVVLRKAGAEFVLSADGNDVEIYAAPLRLPALMADLTWFFTQRAERANSEIALSNGYVLHPHAFRLLHGELTAPLTGREVALLQFMAQQKNLAGECSKEILLSEVWRYHPDSDTHTVETHLWRLRQKLAQAGMTAPLIATTDKGYKLA